MDRTTDQEDRMPAATRKPAKPKAKPKAAVDGRA
jgi:hypothetical protein